MMEARRSAMMLRAWLLGALLGISGFGLLGGLAVLWGRAARNPVMAFRSYRGDVSAVFLGEVGRDLIWRISAPSHGSSSPVAYAGRVFYTQIEDGSWSLFEYELATGRNQKVYRADHHITWPQFSREGKLAYTASALSGTDIAVVNFQARAPEQQPFNTPAMEMQPAWHPDGRLSFVAVRDGNQEIYLLEPDGELVNLTQNPGQDYNPNWSADGRLAFTSTRDWNAEVYVLDEVGGQARNVSRSPDADYEPVWMPDGRLSFVSDRTGDAELYALDLETGELIRLTHDPAKDEMPTWIEDWTTPASEERPS